MENVFYTSLDIRSTEPVDKRLYIDEITTVNLTKIFGQNGLYAIKNATLFNRLDKQFYYFTGSTVPSPDILNPANWSPLQVASTGKFVEWANDVSYEVGVTVYDPATIATGIKFYVAKSVTTIGEPPYLTPEEWLEIGSSASTRQTALATIDSTQMLQTFNVVYTNISLPSLPNVSVFVNSANVFRSVYPDYEIDTNTNTVSITFKGDLTSINNVAENVRVIIS